MRDYIGYFKRDLVNELPWIALAGAMFVLTISIPILSNGRESSNKSKLEHISQENKLSATNDIYNSNINYQAY